jgi:dienelactone hydrolase
MFITVICLCSSWVEAKVQIKPLPYSHGDASLVGMLAWDDALEGKRPGILVVHEWWGVNEYIQDRIRQLAALGYVALAVDMYGMGKVTAHPEEASEWMQTITANTALWQERASEGLRVLQDNPLVDPTRLAAIGYCFGGATVMQLVYGGAPVQGVVSFHGSLPLPPASLSARNAPKIFIAHGEADPFLTPDRIAKFIRALNKAGLDWFMVSYGGAQHSFTNPSADEYGVEGLAYHEQADRRSWEHMKLFFDELFQ